MRGYLTSCALGLVLILLSPSARAQNSNIVDDIIISDYRIFRGDNVPTNSSIVEPSFADIAPIQTLNQIAGVNIQQGSGSESLTAIRSAVLTGGAGAGSFYYGVNGVSVRAAGFGNVNGFLDLPFAGAEQLEIYKGPHPILLGSNALHGGILALFDARLPAGSHVNSHVNSQANSPANFNERANHLSVRAGSDQYLSASLGGVLASETGPSRLAANLELISDGGFRADSGYDKQTALISHYAQARGWEIDSFLAFTNLNQETAGFAQGEDAFRDREIALANDFPEAFRDVNSLLLGAKFSREYSLAGIDHLTQIAPYLRSNEMDFRLHFLPGQALEQNEHNSAGVTIDHRVKTSDAEISFGILADFTRGSLYEFQENETEFSFIQGLHYDFDVKARQLSAYINVNADFSKRLSGRFGLRAENMDYDYDNNADSGIFGRFLRLEDREDSFTYFSPSADLSYEITPRLSGYIRAAIGARAPQISDLYRVQINQAEGRADVETLDSVEIGMEGHFNARSSWAIAAYGMEKRNHFFRDADGFNVVNGRTEHRGFEASANLYLTDHLSLNSNLSLERHTYDFNRNVGNSSEIITAGNRVDTAPDVQSFTEISYQPSHWGVGLSWTHLGEYFTNAANDRDYPGHDIFGLTAHYNISDNMLAQLRVDNVTDKLYADRADFAFGNERFFPGRPRSLYFGLSRYF